jgi:predicted Zn-dependent peptidase
MKELSLLRKKKLPEVIVKRMKQQVRGQVILGWESLLGRAINSAKDYLDFGRLLDMETFLRHFEKVSAKDLHEAAKIIFDPKKMSMIRLVPEG